MSKGFYRHIRAMDVFIQVLKVRYRGPKYLKARVDWWNAGMTYNPWSILLHQNIKILNEHLADWKRCNEYGEIHGR